MIYVSGFKLDSYEIEYNNLFYDYRSKMTCFSNKYPFGVFGHRLRDNIELGHIIIFCGDNGSGKSTILNLIGEKLGLERDSIYNRSGFFEDYLKLVNINTSIKFNNEVRENSRIITSDDVFDYLLNTRYVNEGIDFKRADLMEEYLAHKGKEFRFRSIDDYEDAKKIVDSKLKSKSKYVKSRLMNNIVGKSNGESGLMYFTDKIRENGLYILDEPENSLSSKNQIKLMEYIEDSVRFYGCQFIISSHSPFILGLKDALIYDLDREKVEPISYGEIENINLLYKFLSERKNEFNN
ncbi:MAG: AAA family ATPase [Peptoniphilaceae bacterium]